MQRLELGAQTGCSVLPSSPSQFSFLPNPHRPRSAPIAHRSKFRPLSQLPLSGLKPRLAPALSGVELVTLTFSASVSSPWNVPALGSPSRSRVSS